MNASVRSLTTILTVALFAAVIGTGCASLGTKVRMEHPESVPSIQRIALWPIASTPLTQDELETRSAESVRNYLERNTNFRKYCLLMCRRADSCLFYELGTRRMFTLIDSDSTTALIRLQDSTFDRFSLRDWNSYDNLNFADGIVVTDVDFGKEGFDGTNTYVTMSLYDRSTGDLVVEVKFNTKWGKSYMSEQGWQTTMPDAIHGAVNAFVKTMAANAG